MRITFMYYNRILGRIIFDALDVYLISAFMGSLLASYVKNNLSEDGEKAKMERLRQDLISKSRVLEPGSKSSKPRRVLPSKPSEITKIQQIYRFALDLRGGGIEDTSFEFSQKMINLCIRIAYFLQKYESKNKVIHLFFVGSKIFLQFLLSNYGIFLTYSIDPISRKVMIGVMMTGSATGFALSWFALTSHILVVTGISTLFFVRSFGQQSLHQRECRELQEKISKILKDLEDKKIKNPFLEISKKRKNRQLFQAMKLDDQLNWNQNPSIREAAEQLGIFEQNPVDTGRINLDTSNPAFQEMGEELNWPVMKELLEDQKPDLIEIIDEALVNDKSDFDIIDLEVVKKDPLNPFFDGEK